MENNEKIMNKINGLLAKTVENGCTPEEAAAAAAKAQELLKKYHLELDGRGDREEVASCIVEYSREWEAILAGILAENGCCKVLLSRSTPKNKLIFFGRETDLETVLALYDSFQPLIRRGANKEKKEYKEVFGHSTNVEHSYALGFITSINDEMGKQCRALMLITPKDVKDKLEEQFPRRRQEGMRKRKMVSGAYDRGLSDGRDAAARREIAG